MVGEVLADSLGLVDLMDLEGLVDLDFEGLVDLVGLEDLVDLENLVGLEDLVGYYVMLLEYQANESVDWWLECILTFWIVYRSYYYFGF